MCNTVCIVGLGYVGLPLTVSFAKSGLDVIGFDINEKRIKELKEGIDNTNEVEKNELIKENITFTKNPLLIKKADFIIICVPTPITKTKLPDLRFIESAGKIVGENIKKNCTVILESTVYPGVTEEILVPILEKNSGLKCGQDFKIGYSPERINPGDKEHSLSNVVKIVSGMDDETLKKIADLYKKVAPIFKAKSIKIAESAKVIENIQRDINIALVNELSLIFNKLGIPTREVLEAAGTKWNFHKYTPGLVSGHCIGVDPYYLVYKSKEAGYNPKIITAGREINDYMPEYVAEMVIKGLNDVGKVPKESKLLIMGLTFKENVPDTRNSKARNVIKKLKEYNINLFGLDPFVKDVEKFGLKPLKDGITFDGIVVLVKHDSFKEKGEWIKKKLNKKGILIDIKGMFNTLSNEFYYRTL